MPVKLITWNMQGANSPAQGAEGRSNESKWATDVLWLIRSQQPDFLCLQECGALPASADEVEDDDLPEFHYFSEGGPPVAPPINGPGAELRYVTWDIGTASRPQTWYFFFMENDLDGGRVNMAIGCRYPPRFLLCVLPVTFDTPAGRTTKGSRSAVGMQVQAEGPQIWSLHALSTGPATVLRNDGLALLETINNEVVTSTRGWAALGDYNNAPAVLEHAINSSHEFNEEEGPPRVYPPDRNTRNNAKLDYMVADYAYVDGWEGEVIDRAISDHFPVMYRLNPPTNILLPDDDDDAMEF